MAIALCNLCNKSLLHGMFVSVSSCLLVENVELGPDKLDFHHPHNMKVVKDGKKCDE